MTDWELIFNMLGEKATTDITRTRYAQGFVENKQAARRGGQIAHNARKELEQETGKSVISKDNFLGLTEQKKLENKKKNNKKIAFIKKTSEFSNHFTSKRLFSSEINGKPSISGSLDFMSFSWDLTYLASFIPIFG